MKTIIKKFFFSFIIVLLLGIVFIIKPETGISAVKNIGLSLKEVFFVLPAIFILIGLLDVWVPREIMIKQMGKKSGIKGILLAFGLGSFAAGPLYAAFPIAGILLKKGASLVNILIFIGAWSTTKIPMFMFEYSALGARFAVTRLIVDIPVIVIIATVLNLAVSDIEKNKIYVHAENF